MLVRLAFCMVLALSGCDNSSSDRHSENEMSDPNDKIESLGSLKAEPQEQTKLRMKSQRAVEDAEPSDLLVVAIKVAEEDYVPKGVKPTTHISKHLFTARLTSETIRSLEQDPLVENIEVSQSLQSYEEED
ncbi:MAG: hypothetical protein AAF438_19185 [Pseudomonadota bacterium]